jgi:hypothetical protein
MGSILGAGGYDGADEDRRLEPPMTSSDPPPIETPPPAIPPEPTPGRPAADGPRYGSIIIGLIILGVGLWYFAERTLGLDLPRLDADQLWPIVVIGFGVWLIVRPRS